MLRCTVVLRCALLRCGVVLCAAQDIVDKLRESSRSTGRCFVLLAATGAVSSITLMQAGVNGQSVGVTLRVGAISREQQQ